MKTKNLALIPLSLVLLLGACEDPRKQALRSQMNDLEIERTLLSADITGMKSKTALLEGRLYEQQSDLKDYEGKVEAYILNHKMAVAAILAGVGGATIALDENNEFSGDARAVAGIVAAIALAYAALHPEEIIEVGDYLLQADIHVKKLKSQVKMTEANLKEEAEQLKQKEHELKLLTSQIAELRVQL